MCGQFDTKMYYRNQIGYGSPFFIGIRHQRGGGFWSKAYHNAILPGLRFLGRRAADFGADVMKDVTAGENPMDALTNRAKEQGKVLVDKAADRAKKYALTGKGKKKLITGGAKKKLMKKGTTKTKRQVTQKGGSKSRLGAINSKNNKRVSRRGDVPYFLR